jgi:hypothetical protein
MSGPKRDQPVVWRAETREISLPLFSLIDTRGPCAEALTVGLLLSLGWFAVAWLGLAHGGSKLLPGGVVRAAPLHSEHWTLADVWPSNSNELRSESAPRPSWRRSLFGRSRDEVPLSRVQSGNRSEAQLANGARAGEPPQRGTGTPRVGNAAQPPPATGSRDQIVSSAPNVTNSTPFKIETHSASQSPMLSQPPGPEGARATAIPELPEHVLSSYVGTYAGGPHRQFRVIVSLERGRLTISANPVRTAFLTPVSARRFLVDNETGCIIEFATGEAGGINSLDYICGGQSMATYRQSGISHTAGERDRQAR